MTGAVEIAVAGGSTAVAALALVVAFLARRDAKRSADAAEESVQVARRAADAADESAQQARRSADADERAVALSTRESEERAHAESAPTFGVELATFRPGTTAHFRLRVLTAPGTVNAHVIVGGENWLGFAAGDSGFTSSDARFEQLRAGDPIKGTVRRIDAFADDQSTDILPLTIVSETHGPSAQPWECDLLVRLQRSREM